MSRERPSVGAVVVNYNGGEKILRCIRALRSQSVPLEGLVVVDNGSTDQSLDRIREADSEVRLIPLGENRGLPFARNAGLCALGTELAITVDADLYLAPDCVERLIAAHCEHRAQVICPRILLLPGANVVQCDGAGLHFLGMLTLRHAYRSLEDTPAAGGWVGGSAGGCLLLERQTVVQAGGFDERFFFYFEDLDFSLRMRARGYRAYCEPGAVVFHDWGAGIPGLAFRGAHALYPARRAYFTIRNRWLALLTNYQARTLIVLAPALLIHEVAAFSLALARGWLREWFRALGWLAGNRAQILARRSSVQAARKVPDREFLEGGPLPLAPGLIGSGPERWLVAALSALQNGYWRLARRALGQRG